MNTIGINSSSLNSNPSVKWVISASAIAIASASSSVNANRLYSGSAYGSASVTVTLTETNIVSGRATGNCTSNSGVTPTIIRNGTVYVLGSSFGSSSVWRNIAGSASNDGTAWGEGIASDYLGESFANALATGTADLHTIFYGKSNTISLASGIADSVAIRGTTAFGLANSTGFGEASIQLSGESFKRLDGFVNQTSTADGFVINDYTAIIATNGSFVLGLSEGLCTAFSTYAGKANVFAYASVTAEGTRNTFSTAFNSSTCIGISTSGAISYGSSFNSGGVSYAQAKGNIKQVATAASQSIAYSLVQEPSVIHSGSVLGLGVASSTVAPYANHEFGTLLSAAYSLGYVEEALVTRYGLSINTGTATGTSSFANHFYVEASSNAVSTGLVETSNFVFSAQSSATGVSYGSSEYAYQHFSTAYSNANCIGNSTGFLIHLANSENTGVSFGNSVYADHYFGSAFNQAVCTTEAINGSFIRLATAFGIGTCVSNAVGFSNADIHAPSSRAMIVLFEDRNMIAPEENRTMVVEA